MDFRKPLGTKRRVAGILSGVNRSFVGTRLCLRIEEEVGGLDAGVYCLGANWSLDNGADGAEKSQVEQPHSTLNVVRERQTQIITCLGLS